MKFLTYMIIYQTCAYYITYLSNIKIPFGNIKIPIVIYKFTTCDISGDKIKKSKATIYEPRIIC